MQDYNGAEDCHILYDQNCSSEPTCCCPCQTGTHGDQKTRSQLYEYCQVLAYCLSSKAKNFYAFSPLHTELF